MGNQVFLPELRQDLLRPDPHRPGDQLHLLNLSGERREGPAVLQPPNSDLFWRTVSPQQDCYHGFHTHIRAHTCKHGPTRSHLADGREPPNRQALEEGLRSMNVSPPGPHPPGKGSGNTAQSAGPQDQGQAQPRAGRKQDAVQEGREGPAETARAQAMAKELGQLVCCSEQN